jgi:hypothetical protein
VSSLRNNPILIAVIAAAAATVAFWFLALSPKREEAARLQTSIASKQSELTTARQQVATYEKAKASYKSSYTTLTRLGKAVPADDDIRSLLVQLDVAGHHTDVDFSSLNVGANGGSSSTSSTTTPPKTADGLAPAPGAVPVGTTGISAMPFALTFNGSYFNLTSLFNRLDHFVAVHNRHVRATGRLLRVETINLAPAPTGYPHMTAQVNAASYLVAPTAPAGTPTPATTTPAPATTPSSGTSTPTTTATITGAAR